MLKLSHFRIAMFWAWLIAISLLNPAIGLFSDCDLLTALRIVWERPPR
jgi:hypothetical protein